MGYCLNGVNTGGIPMYLINEFLKGIEIPVIVETGTAFGDSIKEASKYFEECYTIELNEERGVVSNTDTGNIHYYKGHTIDVLPNLLSQFQYLKGDIPDGSYRYILWWLDAHFDGDKPAASPYKDCYVLEELDIISPYSQDSLVIIDDARLFFGNPPYPNNAAQWPTVQQIFATFNDKFPYHYTTIIDDYIISIPDRLKWILDREWMARFSIRYPNENDKLKSQVKDVYAALKNYIK